MTTLTNSETVKRLGALRLDQKSGYGFSFREKSEHLAYGWHSHSRHQLLYSLSGRIILRSREARWLLPPQRAAWIPAGTRHQTTLDRSETISVFFKSIPREFQMDEIRIIRAGSLLREMLLYAARWPAQIRLNKAETPLCDSYFQTLALLSLDWIRHELPFRLPTPQEPSVAKAVDYLLKNLDSANIQSAAEASFQSVRTLRRRFLPATGLTWQQYTLHARMLQAMELLLTSQRSVIDTSYAVGYESPSAFAKAFAKFTGLTPLAFRQSRLGKK